MAEMFERAAYYGVFVVITLYLSNILGFSDIEAGIISGLYASLLYFLPPFTGAYADRIGFRKAMLLAFTLLTVGYAGLALLPTAILLSLCSLFLWLVARSLRVSLVAVWQRRLTRRTAHKALPSSMQ